MFDFMSRWHHPVGGHEDRGATSVEYALMVSAIAVVIVAAVTLFGKSASDLFLIPAGVFAP